MGFQWWKNGLRFVKKKKRIFWRILGPIFRCNKFWPSGHSHSLKNSFKLILAICHFLRKKFLRLSKISVAKIKTCIKSFNRVVNNSTLKSLIKTIYYMRITSKKSEKNRKLDLYRKVTPIFLIWNFIFIKEKERKK